MPAPLCGCDNDLFHDHEVYALVPGLYECAHARDTLAMRFPGT
jgi:hypothetical protein